MKVLILNGSPHKEGCTYTAASEVAKALKEYGVDSEIVWLGVKPIAGCIACGQCKQTGRCFVEDKVNEIATRRDEFDGIILASPVYYAGPNGSFLAFCDRLFYSAAGRFAYKPGARIMSCRRGGASATLDRLNKYFTINNMPVVSSQYWNRVHGNTPDEVKQDKEGLQIMRTLGKNMAWLLKSIERGKAQGVRIPEKEPFERTNFIR